MTGRRVAHRVGCVNRGANHLLAGPTGLIAGREGLTLQGVTR